MGHERRDNSVCRGRRGRRPALKDPDKQMNVIGHNHIGIEGNERIMSGHTPDGFFHDLAERQKTDPRDGGGAVPYKNTEQNTVPLPGADGDEIRAGGRRIVDP